jgi:hypothetical protein
VSLLLVNPAATVTPDISYRDILYMQETGGETIELNEL